MSSIVNCLRSRQLCCQLSAPLFSLRLRTTASCSTTAAVWPQSAHHQRAHCVNSSFYLPRRGSHRHISSSRLSSTKTREALLQWVAADNRKEVARIIEIAERAADRWEVTWTDFLSPPVVADALSALSQMADVVAVPWGGYAQAERCRCGDGQTSSNSNLVIADQRVGTRFALALKSPFSLQYASRRELEVCMPLPLPAHMPALNGPHAHASRPS